MVEDDTRACLLPVFSLMGESPAVDLNVHQGNQDCTFCGTIVGWHVTSPNFSKLILDLFRFNEISRDVIINSNYAGSYHIQESLIHNNT